MSFVSLLFFRLVVEFTAFLVAFNPLSIFAVPLLAIFSFASNIFMNFSRFSCIFFIYLLRLTTVWLIKHMTWVKINGNKLFRSEWKRKKRREKKNDKKSITNLCCVFVVVSTAHAPYFSLFYWSFFWCREFFIQKILPFDLLLLFSFFRFQ